MTDFTTARQQAQSVPNADASTSESNTRSVQVKHSPARVRPVYVQQAPQTISHGITADGRSWTYWIDAAGMPRGTEAYQTDPDRKGSMRRYAEAELARKVAELAQLKAAA